GPGAAKVGTFNKYLEQAGVDPAVIKYPTDSNAAEDFAEKPDLKSIPTPTTKEGKAGRKKAQKDAAKRAAEREEKRKLRRLRAIRVVRALLEKTVAKGCTEEEEQTSRAKAKELIDKYKLTAEELLEDLPPITPEEEAASKGDDDFEDISPGAKISDFYHHGPTG